MDHGTPSKHLFDKGAQVRRGLHVPARSGKTVLARVASTDTHRFLAVRAERYPESSDTP